MYSVTKKIEFCYGHRLLDYEGGCRRLHGHNGVLEIVIEKKELDPLGMVADFTAIKDSVRRWVDENLDHKMILSKKDPLLPALKEHGEPFAVLDSNPTAENIARHVFEHCKSSGLPVAEVRLWETPTSAATYRGT